MWCKYITYSIWLFNSICQISLKLNWLANKTSLNTCGKKASFCRFQCYIFFLIATVLCVDAYEQWTFNKKTLEFTSNTIENDDRILWKRIQIHTSTSIHTEYTSEASTWRTRSCAHNFICIHELNTLQHNTIQHNILCHTNICIPFFESLIWCARMENWIHYIRVSIILQKLTTSKKTFQLPFGLRWFRKSRYYNPIFSMNCFAIHQRRDEANSLFRISH